MSYSQHGRCPKPYVTFIDELTIVDGVILKGQRVIVPENMRADIASANTRGSLGHRER